MATSDESPDGRVLVLMPTAQDAERTRGLLAEAGMPSAACSDIAAVCRELAAGAGAVLLTDEAVSANGAERLSAALAAQPRWSDLPLVVLTREGADARHAAFRESANVTLVERPVRMRTLLSVVRSALRARRHQFAVRDLLAERMRAEAAQAYLVRLADTLRPLSDPEEVQAAANRVLGEHLRANRVAYFEITGPDYVVERDYADGVGSLAGRYPVASFGAALLESFLAGRTVVEADATTHPGRGPDERAAFAAIRVRGHVDVPLVKAGAFVAGMTVHLSTPRTWTADEVALIEQTAERTWAAVERARAAASARERDERLQLLLGHATDYAVIISDPEDRVLEWLGGAEAITGWRAGEALGRPVSVIFTPEDRAAGVPERETGKAAETGRAENVRWHLRKDGSRFFAEGVTVGIRGPAGELRGFGKVFRDTTARKRAEERLTRDAMLLANVHDAVVMTDLEGVITYWNEGAYRLFGWTAEEMIGRPYADRFAEPVRSWVAGEIRQRAAGSEWAGEYEDYRKDGSRVWIDARVTNIRDAAGAVVGVLGVSHDISERKRAEDALRDADRRKDDFIALLAHELRNPLAPIRNGLQVFRLSPDRESRDRAQAMMDRQLTHMVRLIDDLLDVSRITRNKLELRRTRIPLSEAVGNAVETARPAIEAAGHELIVDLPADHVLLDADLTRLAQVFANLLTNSAKYTERGGQIELVARRDGDDVVVSFTDTGIGIPAESLPHVFDMFSQVDRSIERSTGGLGIGLALVKGLVEMHGGTVTAASGGQGKGSEFTVRLPVVPTPRETSTNEPAGRNGAASGPGRRILVVDDNRDAAESMGEMLRLFGNEVALAHDGLEAVERAGAFRPEVILMDVGMPRLNGLDATRRIREQPWGRGVSIVALTGWGQDADRARTLDAGCDGHLVKPVSLDDLTRVLTGLKASKGV